MRLMGRWSRCLILWFGSSGASVLGLNQAARPPNVAGLVIAVDVDPVDGEVRRWTRADIAEEGIEAVAPFRANRDAPRAVILIGMMARPIATSKHSLPASIFRGSGGAVGAAVRLADFASRRRNAVEVADREISAGTAGAFESYKALIVFGCRDRNHRADTAPVTDLDRGEAGAWRTGHRRDLLQRFRPSPGAFAALAGHNHRF